MSLLLLFQGVASQAVPPAEPTPTPGTGGGTPRRFLRRTPVIVPPVTETDEDDDLFTLFF